MLRLLGKAKKMNKDELAEWMLSQGADEEDVEILRG